MSVREYDLIIVGGGLVGLALAAALKPLGKRVAVVEARALDFSEPDLLDGRYLAISHGSQRILEGIGVWPMLAAKATPIAQVHVSDRGHFGVTRINAEKEGLPALGYTIPFPVLHQALYEFVVGSVELFCEKKVKSVTSHENGAMIALKGESLFAPLVIAADGANSSLREVQGIKVSQREYDQVAIVSNIQLKRSHHHIGYERFTDTGPLAILPLTGLHAAVTWTVAKSEAEQLLKLSNNAFLTACQSSFGYRLGRFVALGKRASFPLRLVSAESYYQNHVLLFGNAAHNLHPVAGQGFNLSLRDVAVFAELFAYEGVASKALVERYLKQRKQDQKRTIWLTDTLVRLFSNQKFPVSPLRSIALRKLEQCPPAKSALNRIMMGVSGKVSQLGVGQALEGENGT